jgi:hypothetical protein
MPYVKRTRITVAITESAESHIEEEHNVTFTEVVEAASNGGLLFPVQWGRWALLGQTDSGRLLRVILDPVSEDQTWWVVTAMDMNEKDRRIWRRHKR